MECDAPGRCGITKRQVIMHVLPSQEERREEMISLSIEIIMAGVMFLVGIRSGIEMNRAAQRFALEWRTTRRSHVATSQEQRRSSLILVMSVLFGVVVLPRLPAHFSALIFLPFAAGLALTVLVSLVQKFLPLR